MDIERTTTVDKNKNSLLARVTHPEWERLQPLLQRVELPAREVLYERGQTLRYVHFLTRGCVALMVDFVDGFHAEAGLVGFEGMIGVPLLHGIKTDIAAAVVQVASESFRAPAAAFMRELAELPGLRQLLLRYGEATRAETVQLAACNGHHTLEARLARSLLSLQDRNREQQLPVTHELLATLLSAHRPSISVAAKRMQRAGMVSYAAGSLVIADRPALEDTACECYQVIRDHTEAVLAESPSSS